MLKIDYAKLAQKPMDGVIKSIAVASEGDKQFIAVGSQNNKLTFYDINLNIMQEFEFSNWVISLKAGDINADGYQEVVAGSPDKTVRIFTFDVAQNKFVERKRLELSTLVAWVDLADLEMDGIQDLIVALWDNSVEAYDGESYQLKWKTKFDAKIASVVTVDMNWDGKYEVAVSLENGNFAILNGPDGVILWEHQFPKRINSVDIGFFDQTGKPTLVVGGEDHVLYLSLIHI